jgi:hypothetical protein
MLQVLQMVHAVTLTENSKLATFTPLIKHLMTAGALQVLLTVRAFFVCLLNGPSTQ